MIENVGDSSAGFSVELRENETEIRISGWGFWSVAASTRFAETVTGVCEQYSTASITFDMATLSPLRDEGQTAFIQVFTRLTRRDGRSIRLITASSLIKLQLLRVVRLAGAEEVVQFF